MATGLDINVATGDYTRVEVPERPPSPLAAAEHRRAMALERLQVAAARGGELGQLAADFLIVMGFRDG